MPLDVTLDPASAVPPYEPVAEVYRALETDGVIETRQLGDRAWDA